MNYHEILINNKDYGALFKYIYIYYIYIYYIEIVHHNPCFNLLNIYMYIYVCVYIYIERERERDRYI